MACSSSPYGAGHIYAFGTASVYSAAPAGLSSRNNGPMVSDVYRPLDLSALCNAGVEILGSDQQPPIGDPLFHGLPFGIGNGPNAFIAFDANRDSLKVPIASTAHSVIVAHRLLSSQLMAGQPPGEEVASYVFKLADGTQHTVPIRERFEIGDIGNWGQLPFLG